jgi:PKD repeat protein
LIFEEPVIKEICPEVPKCPTANFSSKPIYAVKFTDLSKGATKWYWTFGDGTNSSDWNPLHVYTRPGSYRVNLTVSNENCTDFKSSIVNVCTCPTPPANNTQVPPRSTTPIY